MFGDNWSSIASIRDLKYILTYASKHKLRVQHLYFIELFLHANVKQGGFMKLDRIYVEYFQEYCNHFVIPLILKKSMYSMTNSGKLFSDEITNWIIDVAGIKKLKCHMCIYYKYAPGVSKLVVLSYVYYCVFWYKYEELGK